MSEMNDEERYLAQFVAGAWNVHSPRGHPKIGAPVESAAERAMHKAHDAVEDLKIAVWTCRSRQQLAELRVNIERLIDQLETTSSVALTCDEHFGDNR